MTKQPKPSEVRTKPTDEEMERLFAAPASWRNVQLLPLSREDHIWVNALEAVDKRQDKTALLELLRSNRPLSKDARWYLADLIERYQLKKPPHKPRTAAYDWTDVDREYELAVRDVREILRSRHEGGSAAYQLMLADLGISEAYFRALRGERMTEQDALDQISTLRKISADRLAAAYKGRNSSISEKKQRRPPLSNRTYRGT